MLCSQVKILYVVKIEQTIILSLIIFYHMTQKLNNQVKYTNKLVIWKFLPKENCPRTFNWYLTFLDVHSYTNNI